VSRQHREIQLHAEGFVLRVEPLGLVGNRIAAEVTCQGEPAGDFRRVWHAIDALAVLFPAGERIWFVSGAQWESQGEALH
jgi:hypothetical protein